MKELKKRTGAALEQLRLGRSISQEALAGFLNVEPVTISRWETGQNFPQLRNRHEIRKYFELSQDEFDDLFIVRSNILQRDKGIYNFLRLNKLVEAGTPTKEIIAKIGEIYDQFPAPCHEGNDYGDPAKWDTLIADNLAFGTRLARCDEWIGYWICLPVTDEFYQRGVAGINVNRNICDSDIDTMLVPSDLKIYFVDLFVLRNHINEGSAPLILKSFIDFFISWAENGYFFEKGFANLSSDDAINYCSKLGFKKIGEHESHVYLKDGQLVPTQIFEVDFSDRSTILFSFSDEVRSLYAEHFNWHAL